MKRFLCFILSMLMVLSFMTVASAEEKMFFYVATDGNDENSGTEKAPFATLEMAVEAAKKTGGANIIVKKGQYVLGDTIELSENDENISIYGDGEVVFTGGVKIPYSSLKNVTDKAVIDRVVDSAAKKNLKQVDLKALGVKDIIGMRLQGYIPEDGNINNDDAWYFNENTFIEGTPRGFASTLTYNDKYLTVAEYPNRDFLYTNEIVQWRDSENVIKFTVADDRWKLWKDAKDIYGYGFYFADYCFTLAPASFDDEGVITTWINYADIQLDRRVRFKNLLEEIDVDGEYYLDTESGILYLLPPKDFKEGEYLTYSSNSKDVFVLNGTKNFKIQGIRFEGTTENVIQGKNLNGLVVSDCEFTAIGDAVIELEKCVNVTVENSYFHDIGSKGVVMYQCGDRQNLIPSNNKIINCHFERFSQYRKSYSPAVHLYQDVATLVSHCEFNDSPHFAIRFESNDTIIEYSEFYNLCQETSDAGAVYSGRRYNTWGNEIRYNYFHDIKMVEGITTHMHVQAVYLDDCHCQTKVYGNVFYQLSNPAQYGGGRYNTFENNLLIDNEGAFMSDNRGMTWSNSTPEGGMTPVWANSDTVDWHTEIWAEKYPELMKLKDDEPGIPKYNIIRNNVRLNSPEFNMEENFIKYGTFENNIEIFDRKAFVKYGEDFSLTEDSVIYELLPDFKPIPFNEIGRYKYEKPEIPSSEPADTIKVLLNDEPIDFADVEPQIINSRTMVPLRAIFEALGATVEWDDATKTVTAVREGVTISMTIGKDSFTRNGESVALDSPATIVDSRTLVPVRAIAESFGCTVSWIADTKTVTIKSE